jgi:hypothetical protein
MVNYVIKDAIRTEMLLSAKYKTGEFEAICLEMIQEYEAGEFKRVKIKNLSLKRSKFDTIDINYPYDGTEYRTILRSFWTNCFRSAFVEKLWDWENGVFASIHAPDPTLSQREGENYWFRRAQRRLVSWDVMFKRSDINLIVDVAQDIYGEIKRNPRKIIPKYKWKNSPIFAKLAREITDGSISRLGDIDDRGTQASIEREILNAVFEEHKGYPSESTARLEAQKLMDAWRRKNAEDAAIG